MKLNQNADPTVLIAGPGLLGGSSAGALKKKRDTVLGIESALEKKIIDHAVPYLIGKEN